MTCCGGLFKITYFPYFPSLLPPSLPLSLRKPQWDSQFSAYKGVQTSVPVLTLAALRGLCFLLHFKSFPIVLFASCLKKNPVTQHLATAQLSLFTLNHLPSSLAAGEASLEATASGTGRRHREGPVLPKAQAALHPTGCCYQSKSSSLLLVLRADFSNFRAVSAGAG